MATLVNEARVSPSESVPTFPPNTALSVLLLYFAVGSLFSFATAGNNSALGGQGVNSDSGGPLGTIIHLLVCGLVFYYAYPYRETLKSTFARLPVMAALAVLPVVSMLWSQNPITSFKQGLFLMASMIFAVYLAKAIEPERLLRILWMTGVIAAISSAFLAVLLPGVGIDNHTERGGEWQGIFTGKNICAMNMFFLLIPVLLMKPRRRLVKYGSVLVILFVIGMTQSKTAWLITIALLIFVATLKFVGSFPPKDRVLMMMLMGGALAVVVVILYINSDRLLALAGRDSTLSGRKAIWAALMVSIMKRPLLGYGYRAFWQGLTGESANVIIAIDWITGYAHNGFLAVWSEVGALGLGLFILSFLKGVRDAVTCFYLGRPNYVDWYISVLLFTPIYNYSEANLMFPFELIWVLYVIACIGLDAHARQRRSMLSSQETRSSMLGARIATGTN